MTAIMKNKRLLSVLAALLFLLTFSACSNVTELVSGTTTGEFPVKVNGVTIGAKPQKVAVLSPSLADVVLALGYETQLAAGGTGCTQASLRDLAKVEPGDVNAIIATNPDLVLLDPASSAGEKALQDAGLTVLNIAPAVDREDFERLYAQVSSALTGDGPGYDAGIAAAQNVFTTMDDINRVVPRDSVTTGCYLYTLDGSAVTGDMLGSTIMTYSGVTNVFNGLTGGQYDFESLRMSNPDLIFCPPGLKETIENDSQFSTLQAVRDGRVTELDPTLMEWQGRTVVTAALEITGTAFPELLEENSMQVEDPADSINSAVSSAIADSALEDVEDSSQYQTLREGDQGEEVLNLQAKLDDLGYLEEAYDGHYGSVTAQSVKDFQKANGLAETGVADSKTQSRLFSDRAKQKPEESASEESGAEASASPSASPSPTPEESQE